MSRRRGRNDETMLYHTDASQPFATYARGDVVVRVVRKPVQLYVVGLVDEQFVEQLEQLAKVRAAVRALVPAVEHDVVHLAAAVLRLVQPVPVPDAFHYVRGRHARVRGRAQRDDLPHEHAERPHVRLGRVHVVEQRFGCHPPDGQPSLGFTLVHAAGGHVPREPKVRDLARPFLRHQYVPGRQIAMYNLQIIII